MKNSKNETEFETEFYLKIEQTQKFNMKNCKFCEKLFKKGFGKETKTLTDNIGEIQTFSNMINLK